MLLEEEPATLISECISNFNIAPDYNALSRISTSLSTLQAARSLRTAQADTALKHLSRRLNALTSQHDVATQSHNPTAHASHILALDTDKFRVAKAVTDAEIATERAALDLDNLQRTLVELGEQDDDGGSSDAVRNDEDETILKLKVYRTLGIDIDFDEATGAYHRATVRNASRGDVHVISIDPAGSRTYYANHFWHTL